jgi:putative transposase
MPIKNSYKETKENINYGNPKKYSENFKHYEYKNKTNMLNFDNYVPIVDKKQLKILETTLKNIKKNKPEEKTKIKSLKTKIRNKKINLNKVIIMKKITIYPTKTQKKILNMWFKESINVYNYCVNVHENVSKNFFDEGYEKAKLKVFKILYDKNKKPAPYDILTDEVKTFISNLKSCKTNCERKNIKKFTMHIKTTDKEKYSIFLPKTAIKNKSIYKTHLGQIKGMEKIIKVENDCRLIYIKDKNLYQLLVPKYIERKIKKEKEEIVSLDPGEKIFQTYYSENSFGKIGENIKTDILKSETQIRKVERIIKRNKNKNGNKIKNKKNLRKKRRKIYEKITNRVKDLHNKTALFLCKKYKKILIPEFSTSKMIKNKYSKNELNKIKEEKGIEEMKIKLKENTKNNRLQKRVKFVLNMYSHYKFKKHLINKGNEYGCEVKEVTEEYTSMTCTKCGTISNDYCTENKRQKICQNCKFTINRDVNGSRNILLKNIRFKDIECVNKNGCKVVGLDSCHKILTKYYIL